MKQWFLNLQEREQKLVVAMAAMIGIFLFYSLVWQPLHQGVSEAEKKVANQAKLLTWVQEKTAQLKTAKSGGRIAAKGSLSSIVNRTASQFSISISRMQPQSDDLQVWLDEVNFSELLAWLEQLKNREGLVIKAIDISLTDTAGIVRVRRLQLGKA